MPDDVAPARSGFGRGLFDFITLGVTVGLAHAVAESLLFGWQGVEITVWDVAIYLAGYGGMGGILAVPLWVAAFVLLSVVGQMRSTFAARARVFAVLGFAGYAWQAHQLVGPLSFDGKAIGAFGAVAGLVALRMVIQPGSALRWVLAVLTLAFAGFGSWMYVTTYGSIAPEQLTTWTVSLVVVPALGLLAVWFLPAPRRADGPFPALMTLVIMGALVMALFATVLPIAPHWHLVDNEPTAAAPSKPMPDVMLVVLDTLRSDHMDLFGYERPTMPLLKRWAEEECDVVTESLAVGASSLPTHASMFSGYFPHKHGAHQPSLEDKSPPAYGYPMRESIPTISETLGDHGYWTAGISSNFGVLSGYGLGRGHQYYDVRSSAYYQVNHLSWLRAMRIKGRPPSGVIRVSVPESFAKKTVTINREYPPYRRAEEITDLAIEAMDGREEGRPSYLFLNYFDPHYPYLPPGEYDQHYVKRPDNIDWFGFPQKLYDPMLRGKLSKDDPYLAIDYMVGQYDGELMYLDEHFHRLIQHMKQSGSYDETMIVVVSDHGEAFMEHGFLRHSLSLFQPQIGVPFLVKLPESWGGVVPASAKNLQHPDILPTVLSVLDLKPSRNLPDLLSVAGPDGEPAEVAPGSGTPLDGKAWAEGRDYSLSELFQHHSRLPRLQVEQAAYARDGMKYLYETDGTERWDKVFEYESDPAEKRDVVEKHASLVNEGMSVVEARGVFVSTSLKESDNAPLTEEMIRQLMAIGYISDKDGQAALKALREQKKAEAEKEEAKSSGSAP